MKSVAGMTTRQARTEWLFDDLDGRDVDLGAEGRARLRILGVYRVALKWWVQYELRGARVVTRGLLPVSRSDSGATVVRRIVDIGVSACLLS